MLYELNAQLVALPAFLKRFLASAGLVFAVASYFAASFLKPQARYLGPPVPALAERPYLPHLLTMTQELGELAVEYSKEVSQSGFGEVTVTFKLPIFHGLDPSNAKSPAFELSGPGIEVAPAPKKVFSIDELTSNPDGIKWTWSFRVKEAGENQLSLVLTDMPYDKWSKPEVNAKPHQLENPIRLPIRVKSVSGFTPIVDYYIKAGGAAAAFLLGYPLIITIFRRKLHLPEKEDAAPASGGAATTPGRVPKHESDGKPRKPPRGE